MKSRRCLQSWGEYPGHEEIFLGEWWHGLADSFIAVVPDVPVGLNRPLTDEGEGSRRSRSLQPRRNGPKVCRNPLNVLHCRLSGFRPATATATHRI